MLSITVCVQCLPEMAFNNSTHFSEIMELNEPDSSPSCPEKAKMSRYNNTSKIAATMLTAILRLFFFIVIDSLIYPDSCRITFRHADKHRTVGIGISLHLDPDDL